mgnify:CR=1 FL=1
MTRDEINFLDKTALHVLQALLTGQTDQSAKTTQALAERSYHIAHQMWVAREEYVGSNTETPAEDSFREKRGPGRPKKEAAGASL